ncbi:MAG: ATP-dependent Clp protease proteolytic subunit [Chlamydiales bacterium]
MVKEEKEEFNSLNDKIDHVILQSRRIFFSEQVDNNSARDAIRKLWYLELTNPGQPITFIINSPGGSIDAGFAIWDQVKMLTSPIITLVTGLAASMGSILSLCGRPGKRYATPNARIMIHQPSISGPITGQATDLSIHAETIMKMKNHLINLYVEHTGKTKKEIEEALNRDKWLSASEALEFGLISKIVSSFTEVK